MTFPVEASLICNDLGLSQDFGLLGAPTSSRNKELSDRQVRSTKMRPFIVLAAACLCSSFAIAQTKNQPSGDKTAPNRPSWPLQLEMRVPFEPTAFPSGAHAYLMYELHLTNFMPMPVSVSRIEVLDADAETAQPIATFDEAQLQSMLQPLGGKAPSSPKDRLVIADGQSALPSCPLSSTAAHIFPTG